MTEPTTRTSRPALYGILSTAASFAYTLPAIQSFFRCTHLRDGDVVILVDNDGSVAIDWWHATFPRLGVYVPKVPASFAQNANFLISKALEMSADFFLLNNDIIFTSGWNGILSKCGDTISSAISNQYVTLAAGTFTTKASMELAEYVGNEVLVENLAQQHQLLNDNVQTVLNPPYFCIRLPLPVLQIIGFFDPRFGVGGGEDDDYSLRAWLHGIPVVTARSCWVLHFQGRSTWRSGEQQQATLERNQKYLDIFRQKWSDALATVFIGRNHAAFTSDPEAHELLKKGLIKEALVRVTPKIAPICWKPKTAAVCCVYEDDRWLPHVLAAAYPCCDKFFFLIGTKPWNGEGGSPDAVLAAIQSFPDPEIKFQVLRGDWASETEQRNFGLDILAKENIDYCLVLDADEVYDTEQLKDMLALVANRRDLALWRMPLQTYWKSPKYRVDPPEQFWPPTVLRVGKARFVDKREAGAVSQATFSRDIGACHHLSYARTDDEVLRKLRTFSHSHQVVPDWYEKVWKAWDANRSLEGLNPCWPDAYHKAIEISALDLPPVLRDCFDIY